MASGGLQAKLCACRENSDLQGGWKLTENISPRKNEWSENIAHTLQEIQPEDLFFEGEMASREMSWSLNNLFPLGGSVWRGGGCSKHAVPALCVAVTSNRGIAILISLSVWKARANITFFVVPFLPTSIPACPQKVGVGPAESHFPGLLQYHIGCPSGLLWHVWVL